MTVMMLGDSHTDIFRSMPVLRFDSMKCSQSVMTLKRLLDSNDTDLWSKLTPWLQNKMSNTLLVSLGEIDSRAHYWRHIPRTYTNDTDITNYVVDKVNQYYAKLVNIIEDYNFNQVIIWGSPIAGEKATWNSQYPFVGSSKTRNILTHIFNREIAKIINNDKRFKFCTAFYHFLNDDYSSVLDAPSHDGVHWHDSCGPIFWNKIIQTALSTEGSIFVGDKWHTLFKDTFTVAENKSTGQFKYHTWARSDQLLDTLGTKTVDVNGTNYSFVLDDRRQVLPNEYTEIGLVKI